MVNNTQLPRNYDENSLLEKSVSKTFFFWKIISNKLTNTILFQSNHSRQKLHFCETRNLKLKKKKVKHLFFIVIQKYLVWGSINVNNNVYDNQKGLRLLQYFKNPPYTITKTVISLKSKE